MTVNSISAKPDPKGILKRSSRHTETQTWNGEKIVTEELDAVAENGVGLEATFNPADYDIQGKDGSVGMR